MKTHCNKIVEDRLESQSDCETAVKDNPVETPERVGVLSHDPTRRTCPFASICDALDNFANIQQRDKESALSFEERLDQNFDVLESHVPESLIDSFGETTDEHAKQTDADEKKRVKREAQERWR